MPRFTQPMRDALQNNVVGRLSRNERRAIEQQVKQFRTGVALSIAVLIGSLIAWLHGGNVSTSIAAFGAALGLGGVIGFLFGVPSSGRGPINIKADTATVSTGDQSPATGGDTKVAPAVPVVPAVPAGGSGDLGDAAPPPPPSADTASVAEQAAATAVSPFFNSASSPKADIAPVAKAAVTPQVATDDSGSTPPDHPSNLEQVADWVTKLLLGGGLTQMQRIPPKIWEWAHNVAIGILKERNPDPMLVAAAQAFAAGLMVYGFILGFFAGFLITKLQLGKEVWQ